MNPGEEAPVVAIDVDGVLADFVSSVCDHVEDKYGVPLQPSDIDEWNPEIDGAGIDLGTAIREVEDDDEKLLNMPVIDGAKDALQALDETNAIVKIVTHRPPEIHSLTKEWLSLNDIPYDEFVTEVPGNKSEVQFDALIDDKPENIGDAVKADRLGFQMLHSYNRHAIPDGGSVSDSHVGTTEAPWTRIQWSEFLSELQGMGVHSTRSDAPSSRVFNGP